jgi:hypothetical protein
MNANIPDIDAVAATVRRYLLDHPNAADTLEGIAQWWLSGHTDQVWLTKVQRAIDQLVTGGEMARRTLRDGTVIYERSRRDGLDSPDAAKVRDQ